MLTNFQQVIEATRQEPVRKVAVAVAQQDAVLEAVRDAIAENIAVPLLCGDQQIITEKAAAVGLDLADIEVVHEPDNLKATAAAVLAVREGRADMLMKGHIHTDDFLRAILDKERGLRTGVIMSHVFILETTARGKLTFVTDGAMNIAPDLVTKADIIMNAVYLANVFDLECPNVGILAAVELVNPKMPATIDAAALAMMARRGQFPDCCVDGPFALDNAVDVLAAEVKGIQSEIGGLADILVCPSIEAGNILTKTFAFLGGGNVAGVLVGAQAPVVLTSRADNARAKLHSIATAALTVNMTRSGRLKVGKVHY
jgi:phosphate butyryltransferase